MNSRGVSESAVARQIAKMTGVVPLQSTASVFPGCAAHIWEWFGVLVRFEAVRWQCGDVDLLRCRALIEALCGDEVRGYELNLLGEVIAQYVRICAADQT